MNTSEKPGTCRKLERETKLNRLKKKSGDKKMKITICISGENCSNDSPLDILLHEGKIK